MYSVYHQCKSRAKVEFEIPKLDPAVLSALGEIKDEKISFLTSRQKKDRKIERQTYIKTDR